MSKKPGKVSAKNSRAIQAIEQKPHKLYIRYLLTKKWSPRKIEASLIKFGLSSATREAIEKYYLLVIRPVIRKYHLGHLYQDYDNALAQKTSKAVPRFPKELNFRLDLGDNIDDQINFLKYIQDVECEILWGNEYYNFYRKREKVPTDPDTGLSLIKEFKKQSNMPWSIIQSPKRYVVDELLLEGLPNSRIIEHMKEHHALKIQNYEINLYRSAFFNIRLSDTVDQIKLVEVERQNILNHIKNVDIAISRIEAGNGDGDGPDIPDLLIKKKALYGRVADLDNNIRRLNAAHSENAANRLVADEIDFELAFKTMFAESYNKFTVMSKHNDRDVVDPMFKLTKMMSTQFEFLEKAKELMAKSGNKTQAELVNLITERDAELKDEISETNKLLAGYDQANVGFEGASSDTSGILGVENLGQGQEEDDE